MREQSMSQVSVPPQVASTLNFIDGQGRLLQNVNRHSRPIAASRVSRYQTLDV
jgi:hypothetical protein